MKGFYTPNTYANTLGSLKATIPYQLGKRLLMMVFLLASVQGAWSQISHSTSFTGCNAAACSGWTISGGSSPSITSTSATNFSPCNTASAKSNIYNLSTTTSLISTTSLGASNGQAVTMGFLYKCINYNNGNATAAGNATISVAYSTSSATGPWTNVTSFNNVSSASCTAAPAISFTPAVASNLYVRIQAVRSGGDFWFVVDDISITQPLATACSGTPNAGTTSLSPTTGVPGATITATVVGASTGSGLTYQWQYYNTTTSAWENASGTSTTTAAGSLTAPAVLGAVQYRRAITCSGATSYSVPATFTVTHCASTPSSNDGSGITSVTVGSTTFPVSDVTYYQYSGAVAQVTQGTEVASSVSFNTGFTYNTNIWIDWNDNGIFDSSELVYQGESTDASPTVLNTSFNLSLSASPGQHRMRIGTADAGQATPNPCYSGTYGVTIDLTVNVAVLLPCSGTPNPGSASLSPAFGPPNSTFTARAPGVSVGTGMTYRWQKSASGSTDWVDIVGATTPTSTITAEGTFNATTYYRLRTTCGNSGAVSYSDAVSFLATYCTPAANTFGYDQFGVTINLHIANFTTTGGVTNINNPSVAGVGGYQNFSSQSFSVYAGQSVNFSITPYSYNHYYYAWVDWNNDGDFTDAGEQILSTTTTTASYNGSYTIPAGQAVGSYRIRILNHANVSPPVPGPCSTSDIFGEYEDYTLNIIPSVAPAVTALSAPSACPGASLVITGTGFANVTGVTIGGAPVASYVVNSITQITAVLAGPASGTVSVTNMVGTGSSNSSFTTLTPPDQPTNIIAATTGCVGQPMGFGALSGGVIRFYTTPTGGLPLFSTDDTGFTNYTFAAVGTYNLFAESYNGSCPSASRATISTITIGAVPAFATATSPANNATGVCYIGTGTLTTLTWGAVTNANSYNVYFGTTSNPDFAVNTTSTSYTLPTALLASTTYYWKVEPVNTICGSPANVPVWSFATSSAPCYCAPTATGARVITNVTFNTINNSSVASTTSYSNYTSISTSVFKGLSYDLSTAINNTTQTASVKAWIDWNRDGVFDNTAGSVEAYAFPVVAGAGPFTVSVLVPTSAGTGATRLRVSTRNSATAYQDPCSTGNAGEFEDYTIIILEDIACNGTPTAATVSPSSVSLCQSGSVTLTASGYEAINGISLQWYNGSNAIAGATSPTYTTPSITQTTSYHVRVTCANSSLYADSNIVEVTVNHPTVVSVTGGSNCGPGPVTLQATASEGATIAWYAAATGGTQLATGEYFTTPSVSATTIYYAGSFIGSCSSTNRTPVTATISNAPTNVAATSDSSTVCPGGTTTLHATAATGTASGSVSPSLAIPDNNTAGVTSVIQIPATCASASEIVSVKVKITHTYIGDIRVRLFSPSGAVINLVNGVGGGADNMDATFQTGGNALAGALTQAGGPYAPAQPFSNLTGSATGAWTLEVRDNASPDAGTLDSWSINFSSTCVDNYTYSWSPADGLSNPNIANPVATVDAETTYTVAIGTVAAPTCVSYAYVTVGVLDQTTIGTQPTAEQTVCEGQNVTLSVAASGSNLSYQWYRNGNIPVGTNAATLTLNNITAASAGTYTVAVTGCSTAITSDPAVVNVNSRPAFNVTSPLSVCLGQTITLNANASNAVSYSWTGPNGFTSTDAVPTITNASALHTGIYTLVATAANSCTNTVNISVNVSAFPAISAAASASTVCIGSSVNLTTSNTSPAVTLLSENFNGVSNAWTVTSSGAPATSWFVRPNGHYSPGHEVSFFSNDNSQFYLSDSDAGGLGSTTNTILRSPAFSTVGMSSVNISFYHAFIFNTGDVAVVETSTNGTSWTAVPGATFTADTGGPAGFVNVSVNSTAILEQPNVYIRFRYQSSWGYYWAIDNVVVTGAPTTTYAWTSSPAGFTSSVQNPTGVAPTETTTYTVTATNAAGCQSTASTTVTVNPASNGGTVSSGAIVCAPANGGTLTVSGYTGTITGWESSTNNFATAGTPIANTTASLSYNNLTVTTYYRAIVKSGVCSSATSTIATITVNQPVAITSATATVGSVCSGSTTTLQANGVTGTDVVVSWYPQPGAQGGLIGTGLTLSNVGPGTYYARVTGACGTPVEVSVTVTRSAHVWNGSVSNSWFDSGNWSCGTVPVSESDVIIPSTSTVMPVIAGSTLTAAANTVTLGGNTSLEVSTGHLLDVQGIIDFGNGSTLTVANDANLIQHTNTANTFTGTGKAVVKRHSVELYRLDYTMWSSPVIGQNVRAFSPATVLDRFYGYNPTSDAYKQLFTATSASPAGFGHDPATYNFQIGVGYNIRMPNTWPAYVNSTIAGVSWGVETDTYGASDANEGKFTGIPFTGAYTVPVSNNTYNAIGNPYPSAIDADAFISENHLADALYFWRKRNGVEGSAYATYTLAGGTNSSGGAVTTAPGEGDPNNIIPNGIIATGQGFIARSASTVQGESITGFVFNNSMRVGEPSTFLRSATTERHRLWLDLNRNDERIGQILVAYMTGATMGTDAAIDGKYIDDSQTALTSLIGAEEYTTQGRTLPFDAADVVPLGFKSTTAGTFTIGLNNVDGLFFGDQDIFLRDNLTGIEHDLKAGSYTFATEAGTFNDRFDVIYQSALAVDHPVTAANSVIVYKGDKKTEFVVNSGSMTMKSIKVYDVRGRSLVNVKDINASEARVNVSETNQVLIFRITSDEGVDVFKKVVN